MKKLLFVVLFFCTLVCANAQTNLYTVNFEGSRTNMPGGWTQQHAVYDPSNLGWQFNNTYVPMWGTLYNNWPADGSYFAYINDKDNNWQLKTNYDTLYTTGFSTTGYAHITCTIDAMYYAIGETATLAVSTDSGATWTTAGTFSSVSAWTTQSFNLDAIALNKPSVRLAITYTDNGNLAWGLAIDNINVISPVGYDLSVTNQNIGRLITTHTPQVFKVTVQNKGGDSIVGMHLNYSVNDGPAVTDTLTSMFFNAASDSIFTIDSAWMPDSAGNYKIKFWCDSINGSKADQNHANDTLIAYFMVVDSVQPKQVMFEEFMQASCDPCLQATSNLDAVLRAVTHSKNPICNPVRYHVSWPGTDYMNSETEGPFVGARVAFYGIDGVPDAKIDGSNDVYPGTVTIADIQRADSLGSPFKITINSVSYDMSTLTYSINASIKSFGNFAAGIKAQAILTTDTIKYADDQSTEDPPSSFPSSNPDSLYQYVVNFPNVAEDMMPSSNGTTLAAFTAEQTQILSLSWTKNHPWGYKPGIYSYDSLFPSTHITLFIQTTGGIPSVGIPANYIFQSVSAALPTALSVPVIEPENYFSVYPNPGNGIFHVKSTKELVNSTIEVYNMLGEKVYPKWTRDNEQLTMNLSDNANGIYLYRIVSDAGILLGEGKLVLQK